MNKIYREAKVIGAIALVFAFFNFLAIFIYPHAIKYLIFPTLAIPLFFLFREIRTFASRNLNTWQVYTLLFSVIFAILPYCIYLGLLGSPDLRKDWPEIYLWLPNFFFPANIAIFVLTAFAITTAIFSVLWESNNQFDERRYVHLLKKIFNSFFSLFLILVIGFLILFIFGQI